MVAVYLALPNVITLIVNMSAGMDRVLHHLLVVVMQTLLIVTSRQWYVIIYGYDHNLILYIISVIRDSFHL